MAKINKELENTEELEAGGSTEENNGNKPHEMKEHSFDSAFKRMEGINNLKYIVEAGDNPLDLLMRSYIPSKRSDAYRTVIAFSTVMRKCREAGDTEGENEIRDIMAMLPSMDGRSRSEMVSALIGYINEEIKKPAKDFMDNMKNKAFGVSNR